MDCEKRRLLAIAVAPVGQEGEHVQKESSTSSSGVVVTQQQPAEPKRPPVETAKEPLPPKSQVQELHKIAPVAAAAIGTAAVASDGGNIPSDSHPTRKLLDKEASGVYGLAGPESPIDTSRAEAYDGGSAGVVAEEPMVYSGAGGEGGLELAQG